MLETDRIRHVAVTQSSPPAVHPGPHPQRLEVAQDPRQLGVRGLPRSRGPPSALVVQVGATQLRYHLGCLDDLHAMLVEHGDWMPLGNADEQKEAKPGTVEAWGRSADNPVGGWYGITKGLRGRG